MCGVTYQCQTNLTCLYIRIYQKIGTNQTVYYSISAMAIAAATDIVHRNLPCANNSLLCLDLGFLPYSFVCKREMKLNQSLLLLL